MKKILSTLLCTVVALSFATATIASAKDKTPKIKEQKVKKSNKDVIKDDEYKAIKASYFNAEGYGDTYNCKVEKQRFCKVKVLDSGLHVLCDRDVSRTQMESAKVFYRLGRCTKIN